jgi:hypothetical protein
MLFPYKLENISNEVTKIPQYVSKFEISFKKNFVENLCTFPGHESSMILQLIEC